MRFLLITLALVLASPLAAETRQYANVIFDVPAGWHLSGNRDDGTLELRADLPDDECGYCVIYITTGARTGGRVDTWLSSQSRRFIDADETPEITTLVKPSIVNLGGRPGALLGQKVDSDLQVLMAVQLFGRMELVGFKASAYDEDDLAEGMRVFGRDVAPMFEAARYVSEGAQPLLPAPTPGDLHGLYWGFDTYWSMGLDGMMSMQLSHQFLTFWPDGTFYDGTPPQGVADFDRAATQDKGDMSWGNYAVTGGKLTLSFANGEMEELSVTDDGIQRGEATMYRVEPLADATRIDGSLSTVFYSGFTPGSGLEGGVSSSSHTRFHPDGTWTRETSGGASAGFVDGGGSTTGGFATSSEDSLSGTYEVKDGLVIRTAKDGSEQERDLIFKSGTDIMIGSLTLATGDGD